MINLLPNFQALLGKQDSSSSELDKPTSFMGSNSNPFTAPAGLGAFIGSLVGGLTDQIESPTYNNTAKQSITADKAKEVLPYLDLSEASSTAQGAPEGWERLNINDIGGVPLHDSQSGFDAEVFKNTQTGEVCVAYRGSESPLPFINDWVEDGRQVAGEHSPQAQHALRLAEAANNTYGDNLSFAGHSLGGALAQASGIATGKKAYTFDSAGLDKGTLAALGEDKIAQNQPLITNIAFKGEFVTDLDNHQDGDASHTGKLLGNTYYADDSGFKPFFLLDNPLTRHFLTPLRESLAETAGIPDTTDDSLDTILWGFNYLTGGLNARH